MGCGEPLGEQESPEHFRKTVTMLFSDVVSSTALGEQLDPETLSEIMRAYFESMKVVVERHEGTVAKFIGDAVMAVFGIPELHEDDALRAVRAAADMRDALVDLNARLAERWGVSISTRTGINTGVVAGTGVVPDHDFVAGDAGNVAARLEKLAGSDEILLGEATYRLVSGAVEAELLPPVELKGKEAPATVYRLVRVKTPLEYVSGQQRTRMVGRKDDLDVLQWALQRAVEERACRLVTILGTAGVGKSRLVDEFLADVDEECTVLRGRCLPYGDGTTFWPLVEIVKQAANISDSDSPQEARVKLEARLEPSNDAAGLADRLAQLAGLAPAEAAVDAPSFAVCRLLKTVAQERSVVAVVDDLHWAEPTLLALVEEVVQTMADAPVVIVCLARSEFVDMYPEWTVSAGGTRLELTPLNEAECDRMVALMLGETSVPASIRARIATAAEGNPLYVEQMVSMLIDDGLLIRTDGGFSSGTDLATIAVPPGIHALLAGRLERLGREERALIGAASVIGHIFYLQALAALVPEATPEQISRVLIGLIGKDLVRPTRSDLPGQEAFAFKHQLIRDVAYDRLSKTRRAEMHERFADWLEAAVGERAAEHGEILGHHLELAHHYLVELGPVDSRGRAVAGRAAEWLAKAGWRSSALGDPSAGVALRRRALALMDADAPGRPQVLAELGDALLWRGLFDEAAQALAEAVESAGPAASRSRMLARLSQLRLAFQIDPAADYGAMEAEAIQAAEAFEAVGDDFGAARAWRVVYWIRWGMCRLELMRPAAERGLEHDRRSRDPHYPQDDLIGVLVSLVWGPTPASVALAEGLEILETVRGHRGAEAFAFCFLGQLRGMLGQTDAAREMIERGVAARQELGDLPGAAMSHGEGLGYFVDMVRGDWHGAERELRSGYETLRAMGDKNYLAVTAGWLAHALIALDRDAEAEGLVEECKQAAARSWVAPQVLWRGAEAVLMARRGAVPAGEVLARGAVDLALQTDRVDTQTDALMDLAEVLRIAGRASEAANVVEDALRRYEHKEVLPAAERARRRLTELREAAVVR